MIQAAKIKSWTLVKLSPRFSPPEAKYVTNEFQQHYDKRRMGEEKCLVGAIGCLNGVPTDEPLDIKTTLVLVFLKHHMLGTLVASLRKNHLESGLVDAIVGGGIQNKLVRPQFNISLKSVVEHDEKQVENLTMSSLKMLADEGVKVLQHDLFTNDVLYTKIAFDILGGVSKFDLLLGGTFDAILLIEGYSDFLTEELLLQVIDIGHNAVRVICQKVEVFVTKSGRNKVDEATRVPPQECYKRVEELAKSGLIEALQSKSKMPQMMAISSLGTRVLTVLAEDGIIKSAEVVETNEVKQDEVMVANDDGQDGCATKTVALNFCHVGQKSRETSAFDRISKGHSDTSSTMQATQPSMEIPELKYVAPTPGYRNLFRFLSDLLAKVTGVAQEG
eukprot:Gb_03836 [translate_table: standard]